MTTSISNAAYQAYEKRLMKEIRENPVPQHLAIIMDGNRRYAYEQGMPAVAGHIKGKNKLEEVTDWCRELGIKVLTVYAFSTENTRRTEDEVNMLYRLFEESFLKVLTDERVHREHIRIRVIGKRDFLPEGLKEAIDRAEKSTENYDNYFFNIAVAYGGREEILEAIKEIAREVKEGKIEPDDITEEMFSQHLYTADLPDPDLILRTSGEVRISNFLLWQMAYSELYFTDVYWPGFRKIDFLRAVRSYQMRKRRFGR